VSFNEAIFEASNLNKLFLPFGTNFGTRAYRKVKKAIGERITIKVALYLALHGYSDA